ncbi:MAG: Maf family nucleotide pyrophosphatase [Muribaculaceae bacterium]|nr:Maf family nucleotide pyrophosphatase [Muribaculaceae bacterium]
MKLNIDGIRPPYPSPALVGRRILLASASPRRRELLAMILPDFGILSGIDVDESYPDAMAPEKVPLYLAEKKARAYVGHTAKDDIVITADTVVIIDGKILGKPAGKEEAFRMLRELSGRTHMVVTGVCVSSGEMHMAFSETTRVTFGQLSDIEIKEYVERYQPFDKAGAYGIQEWTGAAIERIDGCFYNVMGLPIHRLYKELSAFRPSV